jgi:L-malate glycosyltransferase
VRPRGKPRQKAGARDLRVLHLVTSDAYAGLERHVVQLAGELARLGCVAEIACPPTAARLRAEALERNIAVLPARTEPRRRGWLFDVAHSIVRGPARSVHMHDGRSAVAGALLAPLAGGLVVRTQHFMRPASAERTGLAQAGSLTLHRQLNRNLDGYVAVSEAVALAAIERRETGRAKMAVIPPGIELPDPAAVADASAWRRHASSPIVVFAGRLEPERHLEILMRAAPTILQAVPGSRILIAGSGSSEDTLKRLCIDLGIDHAVEWAGWVPDSASVFARGNVYVNTCPREAFGMAVAEAMTWGLPVVAVDSGGNRELVDHGRTGLLVPPADSPALASSIVRLLGDPETARALGDAGRARAVGAYGSARIGDRMISFYEELCETQG